MAAHWYRQFEGQALGPFTADEFRQLVENGLITPDTLVRRTGMQDWVRASEVRGLLAVEPAGGEEDDDAALPTKRYKVLTQKDKWFTSKFDPLKLEEALNSYAEQGWIVKAATTATFPGLLSGSREELIVILER